MKIVVLNTKGKAYEGEIKSAIIPTSLGLIGILKNHAPLLTQVVPGKAILRTPEGEKEFEVGNGVLEVNNNLLTLLSR